MNILNVLSDDVNIYIDREFNCFVVYMSDVWLKNYVSSG